MDSIEEKIEKIKLAIERADRFESNLTDEAKNVPMLGSLKIRALLNNLGAISTHFMDIGVHRGGSTCSAVFNNPLKSITAIDSFESDKDNYLKARPDFEHNIATFKHPNSELNLIVGDSFNIDLGMINHLVDFYAFDAGHSEKDQEMALTYYFPVLSDIFILCVDDYAGVDGCNNVNTGTQSGIVKCNLEILFEHEFITTAKYSNISWWNGYYVALLRKRS